MMFRYLEPDCQKLVHDASLSALRFFAVYVPIKNTELKLTELLRLENQHANIVLNEHFLVTYVAVRLCASLLKARVTDNNGEHAIRFKSYYDTDLRRAFLRCGWTDPLPELPSSATINDSFRLLQDIFTDQYAALLAYVGHCLLHPGRSCIRDRCAATWTSCCHL